MAQVLGGSDYPARYQRCVDEALHVLRKAADQWALGHPEQPPTPEVLEQIIRVFERGRFLQRGKYSG